MTDSGCSSRNSRRSRVGSPDPAANCRAAPEAPSHRPSGAQARSSRGSSMPERLPPRVPGRPARRAALDSRIRACRGIAENLLIHPTRTHRGLREHFALPHQVEHRPPDLLLLPQFGDPSGERRGRADANVELPQRDQAIARARRVCIESDHGRLHQTREATRLSSDVGHAGARWSGYPAPGATPPRAPPSPHPPTHGRAPSAPSSRVVAPCR